MKKQGMRHPSILSLIALVALFMLAPLSRAQSPADYTVQMHATTQAFPPQITLHWPQDPNATLYSVFRKAKGSLSWGSAIGTAVGSDTVFVDNTPAAGDAWEYRIIKNASGYTGNGYCYAGIEAPVQDYYGKVILVVDTTYAAALKPELDRLVEELWGDGWQVIRLDVDRGDSVTGIHDRIQIEWMADPVHVRSVFLVGHVPVPYSGNLNPDGHPEHQGAWPADVYYGEMNGAWTDVSVNNVNATRPQNQNTIGDGKFDQVAIPSDIDLEVGRVDFANMPSFAVGEEALLRQYLNKDHAWRMKQFTVQDSGVIDDNFGTFGGEAFAASGWRNFGPLIGSRHAYAGDFRTDLNARDHLWAYGCGGGWYQGASGVGSTTDFVTDSLRAVFSMIFGSYHGDWDSDDNFMRAALANKGHILSCAWAGRPNWHFHYMGLGEPIGFAAKLTQNNFNTYVSGYGARYVHIALMGDPTLRMHVCAPPSNLQIAAINGGSAHELTWTASPDSILGYAVFRQDTLNGRFWRIATVGPHQLTYTDSCKTPGDYRYMVRAEELRTGYSGSYHNLSQGIMDTITNTANYSIQTIISSPTAFCPGDTVTVAYATVADFCGGNAFTAELSDSTGSFANSIVIGTTPGTQSGTLLCIIPPTADPANGYRIRINASNPAAIGTDNGMDLEILGLPTAGFTVTQTGLTVAFTNTSTTATNFWWDFGDGDTSSLASPTHTFATDSSHTVQLIAGNACGSDTSSMTLTLVGIPQLQSHDVSIVPNPAHTWFEIQISNPQLANSAYQITDMFGHLVLEGVLPGPSLRVPSAHWARGVYLLSIDGHGGVLRRRIVLE